MKEPAQIAYDGYAAAREREGRGVPEWHNLSETDRMAWRAGLRALEPRPEPFRPPAGRVIREG